MSNILIFLLFLMVIRLTLNLQLAPIYNPKKMNIYENIIMNLLRIQ